MVHLLKGKCFDRNRNYKDAIDQYAAALKSCEEQQHNKSIVGNMEFRLGWSMIRAKFRINEGIAFLQKAAEKIPDNVEILLKLAGALF